MNLANKLTVLRIVMVPLFVFFMLMFIIPYNLVWALLVFIAASLTDYLDGRVARKRDLVTDLGKFLDPLADKILVISALICFFEYGWIQSWMLIVIIAREFIVSGIRLAAAGQNKIIAADILGKIKTVVTMLGIIIMIGLFIIMSDFINFSGQWEVLIVINGIIMWSITLLTVISGVSYIIKNKQVFKEEK